MTTSTTSDTTQPRRRIAFTALAAAGALASLTACGGTTDSAGAAPVSAPLPTIGIAAPDTAAATATATA
ncbi:MAG: hypothetical protein WCA57_09385, partial [Ilumatobacteraceae bacterium]